MTTKQEKMYAVMLNLALPFYKRGRSGDVAHIKWLGGRLFYLEEIIKKNDFDFDIIFALTILHDVGYAKLPKGYNPFDLKIRKLHAEKSAEVAEIIFNKVNFPKSKKRKALQLIRHHDDWAFNKPLKDAEWRIFTDLDFAWEASGKGFDIVRKFLNQTREEFFNTVKEDYAKKQKKYPFFFEKSKQLFLQDLKYWRNKFYP